MVAPTGESVGSGYGRIHRMPWQWLPRLDPPNAPTATPTGGSGGSGGGGSHDSDGSRAWGSSRGNLHVPSKLILKISLPFAKVCLNTIKDQVISPTPEMPATDCQNFIKKG
uniref:Uncharacterized protein n=2 Tax=Oryza TaxID=4527 RepID=Q33B60_ORYSJ|nr:hypothetical protein LOC_Os10g04880 [Oryza sativa Japonica Group]